MAGTFVKNLFIKQEKNLLMVGLDGAGKTTILYKLKLGEIVTTYTAMGFVVETVRYKSISFTVCDVGGLSKMPLWRQYYENTRGLIFVVDSNDRDHVSEAKDELSRLLAEDELKDAVLLVFANKQDLPYAMNAAEITNKLSLRSLHSRNWYIQATCATSGDGLYEGLDWLSSQLKKDEKSDPSPNPFPDIREMAGEFASTLKNLFSKKRKFRVLMIGLDAAGKKTIVNKLKLGEIVTTIPIIGFAWETVEYKNMSITMMEIVDKIRPILRHYFQNTQGLIFVLDSNDRERVYEAKDELYRMLAEDELRDAVLLVFANKQDLPNAMNAAEITDKLSLHSLRSRNWYLQALCATSGDGLCEGLDWLSNQLKKAK